jgi:gliding motility-associated-like protein
MNYKLLFSVLAIVLFLQPKSLEAQAPNLGSASDYILFTSVGAVTNSGTGFLTKLTGNVGTNSAPTITGFGNVNGQMHYTGEPSSTQCQADVLTAYNQLNSTTATLFPASPVLGNGDTLNAGIYSITNSSISLSGNLILNGQGNPNAVFILKLQGALSSGTNAKLKLINGAQACNVFWKVEGAINLASGTTMRGTMIANNGAISVSVGDTLEGRLLTTNGSITVSQMTGSIPVGCGSVILNGPSAPALASIDCYATFTSIGANTNTGTSTITGDVGTNSGLTIGYNPLLVSGMIHPVPDASTAAAAADLAIAYNYLSGLAPGNIELLFPAQFGHNLELTPHIYLMNSAVTFTDTVILNAQGNANAVFVIIVNGAFNTNVNSMVTLINGAQAKNIYWRINGAVMINNNSIFNGTLICGGQINVNTGALVNGRVLSINGALLINAADAKITKKSIIYPSLSKTVCNGDSTKLILGFTGNKYNYQWRRGNVNLVDTGHISGSKSDTLKIYPFTLQDSANNYNVIITDLCNRKDTSGFFNLILNTATAITTEPSNKQACILDTVAMSVKATGSNLVYQWRKGNVNLVNGLKFSGVDRDTLIINGFSLSDTASNYNVIVSGSCSLSDTSVMASLKHKTAPLITTEPSSQFKCLGDTVIFRVVVADSNLIYQWRKGNVNLINGLKFSGVDRDTLRINGFSLSDTASNYNVIVSGSCSLSDTSVMASLKQKTAPLITTEPSSQLKCLGDTVIFRVLASEPNLVYQWRKGNVNLVNGLKFSGVNRDTLSINGFSLSDTASNYNVIVSGSCSLSDTSVMASLKQNTGTLITTEPSSQFKCLGDTVKFRVLVSEPNLVYQWRKGNVNLVNGLKFSGVDRDTLSINGFSLSDTASNYNVIVSGYCSLSDTSVMVSLKQNTGTLITTEPSSQFKCLGDTIIFRVLGSDSNLVFQWRKGNVNLVNGLKFSGVDRDTLRINGFSLSDTASNYNVIVSGSCAPSDTSIYVFVRNKTAPRITTEPISQFKCLGDSIIFNVLAIDSNLSYQWRKGNINLVNSPKISGVNTNILTIRTIIDADTANNYHLIVTGNCLLKDTSINAYLYLNQMPTITTDPVNLVVCEKSLAQFTVITTGTNLIYQWRKGDSNIINNAHISGANSTTLSIDSAKLSDTAYNYNLLIKGGCNTSLNSKNVSLKVNTNPICILASNSPVCLDSIVKLSSNQIAGSTYSWLGPNGFNSTTSLSSIPFATINNGGVYSLVITNNNCSSAVTKIVVEIKDCQKIITDLYIPEGFSPNADGVNDLFFIRGLNLYPKNSFEVYNRWGVKIYDSYPYRNDWNGTCTKGVRIGGDQLPVGTYFYILNLGNNTPPLKGTIFLNN